MPRAQFLALPPLRHDLRKGRGSGPLSWVKRVGPGGTCGPSRWQPSGQALVLLGIGGHGIPGQLEWPWTHTHTSLLPTSLPGLQGTLRLRERGALAVSPRAPPGPAQPQRLKVPEVGAHCRVGCYPQDHCHSPNSPSPGPRARRWLGGTCRPSRPFHPIKGEPLRPPWGPSGQKRAAKTGTHTPSWEGERVVPLSGEAVTMGHLLRLARRERAGQR